MRELIIAQGLAQCLTHSRHSVCIIKEMPTHSVGQDEFWKVVSFGKSKLMIVIASPICEEATLALV